MLTSRFDVNVFIFYSTKRQFFAINYHELYRIFWFENLLWIWQKRSVILKNFRTCGRFLCLCYVFFSPNHLFSWFSPRILYFGKQKLPSLMFFCCVRMWKTVPQHCFISFVHPLLTAAMKPLFDRVLAFSWRYFVLVKFCLREANDLKSILWNSTAQSCFLYSAINI